MSNVRPIDGEPHRYEGYAVEGQQRHGESGTRPWGNSRKVRFDVDDFLRTAST